MYPIEILKQIQLVLSYSYKTLAQSKNYQYTATRLRESLYKADSLIRQGLAGNDNWYILYDGLVGSYINLRQKYRQLKLDYEELKKENQMLRSKILNNEKDN